MGGLVCCALAVPCTGDGYVESISEVTHWSRDEATAYFDQMIADIRDPARYAVWMVPVVSGRVPAKR